MRTEPPPNRRLLRLLGRLLLLLAGLALAADRESGAGSTADGKAPPEQTWDLRAWIDAELKSGSRKIVIPPGRYRVAPVEGSHLLFRKLQDVEIVAEDVEMICTATVQAIGFDRCTNVTLRGLTIDYDPLPFTQGEIVALGPDKSWVEFQLFDGYPDNGLVERIEIFEAAVRELRRASYYRWGPFERQGPRRYRVSKGPEYRYRQEIDTEQVGDLLVTNDRTPGSRGPGHAIYLTGCAGMKLEDVTLYAAPSFGFMEIDCTRSTYRRCRIDRRPLASDLVPRASARLRSLNADAFHSKNADQGPAITDCFAHWQGDDCVNINGRYFYVAGSQGRTLRIVTFENPVLRPGDPVEFLPYAGGPLPTAQAVSLAPAEGGLTPAEQKLLQSVYLVDMIRRRYTRNAQVYTLVLDREVNVPPGSAVCSSRRVGHGFLVKNCDFGDNRSRGILIKASRGEVVGNRVTKSRMAAILISPEFHWMEAGSSNEVVVKDNVFRGIGQTPIRILATGGSGQPLLAGAHRDIAVVNNRIEDSPWPLIEAHGVVRLTVAGNLWSEPETPRGGPAKSTPLLLVNCEETNIRQ